MLFAVRLLLSNAVQKGKRAKRTLMVLLFLFLLLLFNWIIPGLQTTGEKEKAGVTAHDLLKTSCKVGNN